MTPPAAGTVGRRLRRARAGPVRAGAAHRSPAPGGHRGRPGRGRAASCRWCRPGRWVAMPWAPPGHSPARPGSPPTRPARRPAWGTSRSTTWALPPTPSEPRPAHVPATPGRADRAGLAARPAPRGGARPGARGPGPVERHLLVGLRRLTQAPPVSRRSGRSRRRRPGRWGRTPRRPAPGAGRRAPPRPRRARCPGRPSATSGRVAVVRRPSVVPSSARTSSGDARAAPAGGSVTVSDAVSPPWPAAADGPGQRVVEQRGDDPAVHQAGRPLVRLAQRHPAARRGRRRSRWPPAAGPAGCPARRPGCTSAPPSRGRRPRRSRCSSRCSGPQPLRSAPGDRRRRRPAPRAGTSVRTAASTSSRSAVAQTPTQRAARPPRRRAARPVSATGHAGLAQQRAADDHPLHLAGALVEPEQPGVAVEALDRRRPQVAQRRRAPAPRGRRRGRPSRCRTAWPTTGRPRCPRRSRSAAATSSTMAAAGEQLGVHVGEHRPAPAGTRPIGAPPCLAVAA